MSSTLYKDALLEVDELKRMAEENAKNKIIEAVTPRIRQLIESRLLGEQKAEDLDEMDDLLDQIVDEEEAELDMTSLPAPEPIMSEPVDSGQSAGAPKIKIDVAGDLNIEMEEEVDEDDDLILGQQVSDVVENYILGKRSLRFRINELSRKTRKLSKILETINLSKANSTQSKIALLYYAKLLDEAVSLATGGIIIEESVDLRLLSQLKTTIKEIRQMAKRRDAVAFRRLLEELEKDESLKELVREEDEDGGDADEGSAELAADEVDADVAAASDAAEELKGGVDDLLTALGLDVEEDVEVDEELEVDDGGEVAADEEVLELGEADDADLDEVYEIDETMLRRELLRMKEGLEGEAGASAANVDEFEDVGDPLDAQDAWGGSDEVIEVSEKDLVEALHLELNRARRSRRPRRKSARLTRESRRRRTRSTRSRSSGKGKRIAEANVKLRKQLHEMNVFNAKLLFANKLMQNRELTKRQQRAIVEALDSAKTVNEAKLLYKSLSASLTQSGNLSESKNRLLASSSRSTRSASPAANGVDGDRWALLAGLSGKK